MVVLSLFIYTWYVDFFLKIIITISISNNIYRPYVCHLPCDGYYVAYKPITLLYISFMFIEIKVIHYHFSMMFVMKSMNIYNDKINYDEIIIQ